MDFNIENFKRYRTFSSITDQPHLVHVCLTETKLSADVDDNLISNSIPGYSIVRRDRNNHGGGVAIYYKTDLKVTRSDFTELKQELVMLKLETRFVNILIGCLYRPPSAPTAFWGALDQQLEEVLGVEHPPPTLLLTGDLNVDILDTKHPHYNHLHSFLATHNLTIMYHRPLVTLLQETAALICCFVRMRHSSTPVHRIRQQCRQIMSSSASL